MCSSDLCILARLDELEPGEQQDGAGGKTRGVCDQSAEGGVQASKMSYYAEEEVLAPSAVDAGYGSRQGFKQGIDSFAAIEPAGDHLGGRAPGVSRRVRASGRRYGLGARVGRFGRGGRHVV